MTGQRQSRVVVMRAASPDAARALLREGVEAVGVPARSASGSATILAALTGPAYVDPGLVEALVDLLRELGWSPVTLLAAITPRDHDLGTTDFDTVRSRFADAVNIEDDLVEAPVPASSVLAGRPVSAAWTDASLRVVLARSVSDIADGFAGCLDVCADVAAPAADVSRADLAADVHLHLPATLALVDATVSSHGVSGRTRLEPLETDTLVVADDAFVADVVLARLQGLDPAVSRPVQVVLRRSGLADIRIVCGDLTPFAGWQGPSVAVRDGVRSGGPAVERLAAAVLADGESDAVLGALRHGAAALADRDLLNSGIAAASLAAAHVNEMTKAWSTVLDKSRIERIDVPLGFDPGDHDESEYRAVPDLLAPFEALMSGRGPQDDLRWMFLDRAVVFSTSRLLQAPFDLFAERVDVSRGISLMADYVGGRVVTVQSDEAGRPTLQAERNIYLPEPNYLAFWGGLPIDVCKIELVEYGEDVHRLSWRTVSSPNGSATYDDGSLTFSAEGDCTRITVLGRQLFTLPPFWAAVDLDRFPDVKEPLVEDAYRRFFGTTFDNLESCYEGRDFRIGRDPVPRPLPTVPAAMLLDIARDWIAEKPLADRLRDLTVTDHGPAQVDEHGFRHFSGSLEPDFDTPGGRVAGASRELAEEYAAAWRADWRRVVS